MATHSAVWGGGGGNCRVSSSGLSPQASVGNCWASSTDVPSSAALDSGHCLFSRSFVFLLLLISLCRREIQVWIPMGTGVRYALLMQDFWASVLPHHTHWWPPWGCTGWRCPYNTRVQGSICATEPRVHGKCLCERLVVCPRITIPQNWGSQQAAWSWLDGVPGVNCSTMGTPPVAAANFRTACWLVFLGGKYGISGFSTAAKPLTAIRSISQVLCKWMRFPSIDMLFHLKGETGTTHVGSEARNLRSSSFTCMTQGLWKLWRFS